MKFWNNCPSSPFPFKHILSSMYHIGHKVISMNVLNDSFFTIQQTVITSYFLFENSTYVIRKDIAMQLLLRPINSWTEQDTAAYVMCQTEWSVYYFSSNHGFTINIRNPTRVWKNLHESDTRNENTICTLLWKWKLKDNIDDTWYCLLLMHFFGPSKFKKRRREFSLYIFVVWKWYLQLD